MDGHSSEQRLNVLTSFGRGKQESKPGSVDLDSCVGQALESLSLAKLEAAPDSRLERSCKD